MTPPVQCIEVMWGGRVWSRCPAGALDGSLAGVCNGLLTAPPFTGAPSPISTPATKNQAAACQAALVLEGQQA